MDEETLAVMQIQLSGYLTYNKPELLREMLDEFLGKGGDINAPLLNSAHDTLLHRAIEVGYPEVNCLRMIIEANPDLEAENEDGYTALQMAAKRGRLEQTKLLLEAGASLDKADARGWKAIHFAAAARHGDAGGTCIGQLLEAGASATEPTGDPEEAFTPLQLAIDAHEDWDLHLQNDKIVRLMRAGAGQKGVCSSEGDTLLHVAARRFSKDNTTEMVVQQASNAGANESMPGILEWLLTDENVDVNVVNNAGETPLHCAAGNRGLEDSRYFISVLLDKGADIHSTDKNGRTPLLEAVNVLRASKGLPNADPLGPVKLLLAAGAAPNKPDINGNTAVHGAQDNPLLMSQLLGAGGDLYAENKYGDTPLYMILRQRGKRGYRDCLQTLCEDGNGNGIAPIHVAAMDGLGAERIAEMVIDGADINDHGKGFTPLHWAVLAGQADTVKTLLLLGADTDPQDPNGRTPLHHAIRQGNVDIAQAQVAHGATPEQGFAAMVFQYQRRDDRGIRALSPDGSWLRSRYVRLRDNINPDQRRQLLQALVQDPQNLNWQDARGDTLLHHLCRYRASTEDIEMWLSAGAEPNLCNRDGEAPLYTYLREHPYPTKSGISVLVQGGADPAGLHRHLINDPMELFANREYMDRRHKRTLIAELIRYLPEAADSRTEPHAASAAMPT